MIRNRENVSIDVLPVTQKNYKQAAQVLGRAFVNDPVSIASYKGFSAEKLERALTVDFLAELRVCIRRGYPIQVMEDGNLSAVAVIYPPGTYPHTIFDRWLLQIKSIFGNGFYDLRNWLKWLNEVDKLHPTEAHFYLEYLGVDPECQGKGYGTILLNHMVEKADGLGVGCYLENANHRNLPFYQRAGFTDIRELEIIGIPTWLMWRPRRERG